MKTVCSSSRVDKFRWLEGMSARYMADKALVEYYDLGGRVITCCHHVCTHDRVVVADIYSLRA